MGDARGSSPLTFESVWAMFQETDKRFKEAAEQHRETEREVKETIRAVREMSDEMRAADRRVDKSKQELDRKMGDLGNRFGELVEHLVAPSINEKFNALGFHFNATFPGGLWIKDSVTGQYLAEIDILLQNTECMVAVEVKSKLGKRDIEDHVKRLKALRVWVDEQKDHRKIYGAMAGAIMSPDIQQRVVKAGFYAIVQTGDTVKIDVPEGFIPQSW